jgi:DNA adenine methylase
VTRHNTPLRYPGGKQKLTPFIREVLEENNLVSGHYAEPYAGGAGVAVELLLGGEVEHIYLNDASFAVYSFWKSIIQKAEDFCRRIKGVSLTVEEWKRQRDVYRLGKKAKQFESGFAFFYLNRCNRSGILNGGVIGGLDQTGTWKIDARFPKNELIRRIELIHTRKQSITLSNLDAETFIKEKIPKMPRKTLVYCDPPYYLKGDSLYQNFYKPEDHKRIAKMIQERVKRPWIVSYDNARQIRKYYKDRAKFVYDHQYNASTVYKGEEIFIFSDSLTIPNRSVLPFVDHALLEQAPVL